MRLVHPVATCILGRLRPMICLIDCLQGCETIMYCSVSGDCADHSGRMYRFRKHWKEECARLDREFGGEMSERLWLLSENLVQFKERRNDVDLQGEPGDSCGDVTVL